jgi:uncharacterized repeat protein (TIGR01451 family)
LVAVAVLVGVWLVGQAYAEREFLIEGTVDCGLRSGQRCTIDGRIVVWTSDVTGERTRVVVDLSWVTRHLDSYDQDDPICLDVRIQPDNTLQAVGVVAPCHPDSRARREEDQNQKVTEAKAKAGATLPLANATTPPTPTFTPTGTASPTATPTSTPTSTSVPTVTIVVQATTTPPASPTMTATPTATATSTATPTYTATPTATPRRAGLSIKTVGNDIGCGEGCSFRFTVTVQNDGPEPATNVVVSLTFDPDDVRCIDDPSTGTVNEQITAWTVPSLASGANATLVLPCVHDGSRVDGYTLTAEITAVDQPDPNSTPNNHNPDEDDQSSATLRVPVDLRVTKTGDDIDCKATCALTWIVTVHNDSPITATNLVVQERPANFTVTEGTPDRGTYNTTTNRWTVGTLDGFDSATLTVKGIGNVGINEFSNTVEVFSVDQPDKDSTPNNNKPAEDDQATATLLAPPPP